MSLSFLCGLFGYTRQPIINIYGVIGKDLCPTPFFWSGWVTTGNRWPRLGGRKLWHLLQQDGFPVSRDRLFTLLSENNLLVKTSEEIQRYDLLAALDA